MTWRWVKGHSGDKWNERADALAAEGAAKAPPVQAPARSRVRIDWTPRGGECSGPPLQAAGAPPRDIRFVGVARTEADRVLHRARTRFGVLNMRVPAAPVPAAEVHAAAKKVTSRILEEELEGRAAPDACTIAIKKVKATAKVLAGFGSEQKRDIDARRGRETPAHVLDVDIDTERLKAALEAAGETGPARTCAKQVREIMKSARAVRPGVVRYRVQYTHSDLGRDLLDAGHVTGCRLSAVGPDPFKWATEFRVAALHGSWNADDTACYPTARQAMTGGMGGVAAHFLEHRKEILRMLGDVMFGAQLPQAEKRYRAKRITTAYDMGASLDFWKADYPEAEVSTLAGTRLLAGGRIFSIQEYRDELARAASWMAERAESMMAYLSQEDHRARKKKGKRKRRCASPILTLKSFILQEAEAVGREAKLRAAAVMGLRVVSLQHDGVAFTGFGVADRQVEIAEAMSREVTAACGYRAVVALEAAQV